MPYKAGDVNPETGVPFKDEAEWKKWDSDQRAKGAATAGKAVDVASKGATSAGGYNWGGIYDSYVDSYNGDIYAGNLFGMGGIEGSTGVENYKLPWTDAGGDWNYSKGNEQSVHIDPHTGKITYMAAINAPRDSGAPVDTARTIDYDPYYDYGLGAGNEGIMVLGRSSTGTPTKFYAATQGGGGTIFTDFAAAKAAVEGYRKDHPNTKGTTSGTTGTTSTTGATSSTTGTGYNPKNDLTQPQQGEQYFDSTKGFYTSPTQASKTFSDLKWDPTQPTDSQQLWAGIGGKYNDPNHQTAQQSLWGANSADYLDPNHKTDAQTMYGNWASTFSDPAELDAMYDRAAQAARTALDRRAASSGWGDSGAAARATGNIGIQFQDAATKAKMDWAKTGMGLADASDKSRNEFLTTGGKLAAGADDSESVWAKTGMDLAGQSDASLINQQNALTTKNLGLMTGAGVVDTQNRSNIWQGQEAANSAEDLLIRRANSDIGNATNIGNIGATIASSGLGTATSTELQLKLAALAAKLKAGDISSAQAYNDAAALVSSLGVVGKSADQILAAFKNGNASPDQILDDTLKKKGVTVTSTTSDAQIDELLRQFGNG